VPTSSASLRLAVAVLSLVAAGTALAAPAAAMEDSRRPAATVTHGPSCGPAVVRALVTNGTAPHRVALVFDGGAEQDAALLAAGEQVELVSSGVDWGVTVDVSVAVTSADGQVEAPLELDTYTRPSAADCAAVTPPSGTAPTVPGTPSVAGTVAAEPASTAPASTAPASTAPASTVPASPVPDPSAPAGTSDTGAPPPTSGTGAPPAPAGSEVAASSPAAVSPGGVVTVRATGFTAGEPVTVSIPGVDEPLTTVTAAADGSVQTVVQIPRGASLGATTVQFTGTSSAAVAGVDLDVAARNRVVPQSTGSPVTVAAGLALVAAAGTLGLMGARRSRGRHTDADR
jgi:hypothetical protein